MKNAKVRGYRLWVMGLLLVSTGAMAQTFQTTVENNAIQSQQLMSSGSTYNGTVYEPFSNTTPSEQSAVGSSYGPARSGPRREKIDGGDTKPSEQSPVGDALLPLLLCAAGFAGVIAMRRRRVKELEN